ncbi:MAG: extracellular solute-binding protein [Candidatus Eremiobacterota bacterium]
MRFPLPIRLLLLGLLLTLTACGQQGRDPNEVLLWTGFESELPTLHQLAREFRVETGISVRTVKVPFSRLRDKYLIAAPAGQGPDLLIGPQDWVGILTTAGLLEPLPEAVLPASERVNFLPVTVQALEFEGRLYAVPLVADCVALIRNPTLVPHHPDSLDELVELARAAQAPGVYGFYYELEDLYFSWPIFAAYGARLFQVHDGRIDPTAPALDEPAAVRAASFLQSLRREGLIPVGATTDMAKSFYVEGRAGMILNGPWFLQDLRNAKVAYAIEPIPGTRSHPAAPLVTVQGIMLNNRAVARENALRFLSFMARPGPQTRVALASGRPPAHREALAEAGRDATVGPDLQAFARVIERGTPMPNHPAVSAVWAPMKQALELITTGVDPAEQLHQTRLLVERKIRQMME